MYVESYYISQLGIHTYLLWSLNANDWTILDCYQINNVEVPAEQNVK